METERTGRLSSEPVLHSVTTKESLLNHQVSRADTEVSERSGSTDSEGIATVLHERSRCASH